jgi:hypothetical protein
MLHQYEQAVSSSHNQSRFTQNDDFALHTAHSDTIIDGNYGEQFNGEGVVQVSGGELHKLNYLMFSRY